MAKIVIAGASDCPYFAKIELLADELQINLPNFFIHKIVKTREEWQPWLEQLSKINNWPVTKSPVIWRELVDRGGKGHLIGGPNEFQEYVRTYYDIKINMDSDKMQKVAQENVCFKIEQDKETREIKALSIPTKICIIGALNQTVPHLTTLFGKGSILGMTTDISITYYDNSSELKSLKSLQLNTFDLAFPLIRSISITGNLEAAVVDSKVVVIFDRCFSDNNEMKESYEMYGCVIEKCSPTDVRVLLVPSFDSKSMVVALTTLHNMLDRILRVSCVGLVMNQEQHVRSVLAKKLSVNPSNIHNIVIWGNPLGRKYYDLSRTTVQQYNGAIVGPVPFSLPVTKLIWDKQWLLKQTSKNPKKSTESEMLHEIQRRQPELYNRNKSISDNEPKKEGNIDNLVNVEPMRPVIYGNWISLAHAVAETLRLWIQGEESTPVTVSKNKIDESNSSISESPIKSTQQRIHSLLVASEGVYGLPERLVFSLPVCMSMPGYWSVVQDMELGEEENLIIKECQEEIIQEVQSFYPWMNQNIQDMEVDEKFVESQIKALLDEFMDKEKGIESFQLLQSSLSHEDLADLSKNKELLKRTLEDLQQSQKPTNSIVEDKENRDKELQEDLKSKDLNSTENSQQEIMKTEE